MRARRHNAPTNPRTSVSRPKTPFEKAREGVRGFLSLGRALVSQTPTTAKMPVSVPYAASPASLAATVPSPPRRDSTLAPAQPAPPIRVTAQPVTKEVDFDAEIDNLAAQPLRAEEIF